MPGAGSFIGGPPNSLPVPTEAELETSSPSWSRARQARTALSPFRSTRQSKHVPIPQKSPRRWAPVRVVLHVRSPLDSRAPATVLPRGAVSSRPSNRKCTSGGRADVGEEGLWLRERSAVSSLRRSPRLDVVKWCAGAVPALASGVAVSLSEASFGSSRARGLVAPVCGGAANRSGANGARSMEGVWPRTRVSTISAVTSARPMPAPSWPVAW